MVIPNNNKMNANFQEGQKVLAPDGGGLIEEIIGEKITVKLNSGELTTYPADKIEDDSDQG
jgi:hypothetical protein